jgi:hypothetical protein
MNYEYDFEIFLIILKTIIVVLWFLDIYLQYTPEEYRVLDIKKERFWAERVSFLFEILIAFLLIYLFNPFYPEKLTKMTKLTLFTVGIMTILRADWLKFMYDSPLIKLL